MLGRDLDKNVNTIDLANCDVVPVETQVDDKSSATLEDDTNDLPLEDKGIIEGEKDKGTGEYNDNTIIEEKKPENKDNAGDASNQNSTNNQPTPADTNNGGNSGGSVSID
ncbi:hypothetical protein [Paraclostridium bifermentans]|uniref:hypothetical protein n=1 Tax=Paraclostridium bifermentans TaxID=1490 RepID=UPI00374F601A